MADKRGKITDTLAYLDSKGRKAEADVIRETLKWADALESNKESHEVVTLRDAIPLVPEGPAKETLKAQLADAIKKSPKSQSLEDVIETLRKAGILRSVVKGGIRHYCNCQAYAKKQAATREAAKKNFEANAAKTAK